jgi:alkylation response protein AidB-like acyl-CoA dehydrogenase
LETESPIEDLFAREVAFRKILWDAGWTRLGWPEAVGGRGGDALLRGEVYEELCASGYPMPETLSVVEVLGPMMLEYARPLAERYLPKFLRGDEMWCQGFSEPNAGSDLAAIRTRAADNGDHYLLNGQKIWTTMGHLGDRCVVLARTGSLESAHRGITAFLVDMDSPGVEVRPIRAATGRNEFAELFFDDVAVPADRVVGDLNGGWAVAMYILQWERGMYGWQRQSLLHSQMDRLLTQLESPGGEAADRLGEAYLAIHSLRMTCRKTLRRLADGQNPGPEISVDKILLATAEQTTLDTVRDLLDPQVEIGDDESSVAWRREFIYTRSASIYGGAGEIQRNIVAERLLGLPKEASRGR